MSKQAENMILLCLQGDRDALEEAYCGEMIDRREQVIDSITEETAKNLFFDEHILSEARGDHTFNFKDSKTAKQFADGVERLSLRGVDVSSRGTKVMLKGVPPKAVEPVESLADEMDGKLVEVVRITDKQEAIEACRTISEDADVFIETKGDEDVIIEGEDLLDMIDVYDMFEDASTADTFWQRIFESPESLEKTLQFVIDTVENSEKEPQ